MFTILCSVYLCNFVYYVSVCMFTIVRTSADLWPCNGCVNTSSLSGFTALCVPHL